MNGEFLYNLFLVVGLFVGLMIMMLRFRAADRAEVERVRAATAEEVEEWVRAAEQAAAENRFNLLQTQTQGPAKEVGKAADGLEETRAELKETKSYLEKQIRKTNSALTKEIRRVDDRVRQAEKEVSEVRGHLGFISYARQPHPAQLPPASSNPRPAPTLPDDAEPLPPSNVCPRCDIGVAP